VGGDADSELMASHWRLHPRSRLPVSGGLSLPSGGELIDRDAVSGDFSVSRRAASGAT